MRTPSRRAWAALTQVTAGNTCSQFGGATCRGELRGAAVQSQGGRRRLHRLSEGAGDYTAL
eukprot:2017226-Prymnesium_polylepis.1